jgi:hypothetical protein
MSIRRSVLVVVVGILVALVSPLSAHAAPGGKPGGGSGTTCRLPESNADALVVLNNYYPNRYWWATPT